MDDRTVWKVLLPSFIITILSTVFIYELKNLTDIFFFKKKHILVVGILSAPENFDKRLSIRKTWLQLLPEISGSYYFIVGNEICSVPPFDRVNPYSCTDLPYILPENVTQGTEFTTMKIHSFESKDHTLDFIGFGFYVRKSIVVKKIGILKGFVEAVNKEIQVELISAIDNIILASVTFDPEMLNESNSEFITKTIQTLSLRESGEVYVKIGTKNLYRKFYQSCGFTSWQFEPNVLHFTHLWEEDSVVSHPFTEKSCSFVFITYNILDVENIKLHLKNRKIRQMEWKRYNKKLSIELKSESQTYQDLLFVDVTDVYRNLSKKMIQFYKKVVETEYFHYILKADDDSFIDLLRIYNQLQLVNKEIDEEKSKVVRLAENGFVPKHRSKFWLWSYFKEYWKVQRAGKWREDYYQSALYPSFPCGGGYVINKDVADYIVANEQNLQNFQGEDVSLGIWLSPLPIRQYKTPKTIPKDSYNMQKLIQTKYGKKSSWSNHKSEMNSVKPDLCHWTCNNKRKNYLPLCNKVQLTVEDMYETWAKFTINGFL